jgi:biopolymer transport protein ExbD
MSFQTDDTQDEISEINMTPLVDVMMVLLIIFMITAPIITHSVKVDLPQASQASTQDEPDKVTLTVQHDGSLLWNNTPINAEELALKLNSAAENPDRTELRIQGDKKVEYEKVIQVMAAAQRAGLKKLNFITQPAPSIGM